jgi:hypothetical protein
MDFYYILCWGTFVVLRLDTATPQKDKKHTKKREKGQLDRETQY